MKFDFDPVAIHNRAYDAIKEVEEYDGQKCYARYDESVRDAVKVALRNQIRIVEALEELRDAIKRIAR